MAPITGKRKHEDDFVLTLSDDEGQNLDGNGSEDDNSADVPTKTETVGKKRRREENENATNASANKKQKKKSPQQQAKDGKRLNGGRDTDGQDDVDVDEEGERDVLNPDFEFDFGDIANNAVMEDFDGWGTEDRTRASGSGNKKPVDIDDIIERKKERQMAQRKKKTSDDVKSDEDSEGSEAEGNDQPVPDFNDDELLAPDGFGMGVAASEPDEEEHESESGSEASGDDMDDKVHANQGGTEDNSDDDSVASPVAHPEDLEPGSDSSSEAEDEDPEEIEKRKAFFAPEEKSTGAKGKLESSMDSFQGFSLSRPILRGLASVGFSTPTPIQRKTIPIALLGKDVVGGAVTGSGKTGAFIVPILERLLYRPRKVPTSRVAILMPTRELAVQCYNVAVKLATFTDITFCQLVGGFSLREQENVLKQRPDVIIATPGRFIDHMRNSASFTVDTLEILVLDEADRMLEDGFANELNEILTTIPKSRQTMLFSATMTNSVDQLIRVGLNRPVRLLVDAKKQTVGSLVQEFVRLRPGREDKRMGYLLLLCGTVYTNRVIIFFRQKKEAHRARIIFGLAGLKAAELHGSMRQEQVSSHS